VREKEIRETIGIRFLELLRNRFKNPPFLLSRDLYMLKGHIPFASCFMNDREPRGERHFQNVELDSTIASY
jgi:hypothetical protein